MKHNLVGLFTIYFADKLNWRSECIYFCSLFIIVLINDVGFIFMRPNG